MTQSPYIPLTAIDCTIPALLIDRNAPLDVLHANAVARVLAVTQLMETFSSLPDPVGASLLANKS